MSVRLLRLLNYPIIEVFLSTLCRLSGLVNAFISALQTLRDKASKPFKQVFRGRSCRSISMGPGGWWNSRSSSVPLSTLPSLWSGINSRRSPARERLPTRSESSRNRSLMSSYLLYLPAFSFGLFSMVIMCTKASITLRRKLREAEREGFGRKSSLRQDRRYIRLNPFFFFNSSELHRVLFHFLHWLDLVLRSWFYVENYGSLTDMIMRKEWRKSN